MVDCRSKQHIVAKTFGQTDLLFTIVHLERNHKNLAGPNNLHLRSGNRPSLAAGVGVTLQRLDRLILFHQSSQIFIVARVQDDACNFLLCDVRTGRPRHLLFLLAVEDALDPLLPERLFENINHAQNHLLYVTWFAWSKL
jgi:hypothetical protein